MKKIKVDGTNEILSLVSDVSYRVVSDWHNATYKDLKMNLIIPKHHQGLAKRPCILFLGGGSYRVASRDAWIVELEYYARRGYIVATCEYRTTNSVSFPEPLIDIKAAVRYLKAHQDLYCIDPNKIVLAGESAGGTLSTLASVYNNTTKYDQGDYLNFDSKVAAVVDFYGQTDFVAALKDENSRLARTVSTSFVGESNIEEASSYYQINKEVPPTLIFHGDYDDILNINDQSTKYYEKLKSFGVPCEYYILEGATHSDDAFYQTEIKELVLQFLNRLFV